MSAPRGFSAGARSNPLQFKLIGKETNLLERQEAGLAIRAPQAIYSSPSEWERMRSRLGEVSIPKLAKRSGVSERMLRYLRDGARQPSPATAQAVFGALGEMLGR